MPSPKSTRPSAYDKLTAAKAASTPAAPAGPSAFFSQGGKLPTQVNVRPQQLTGQVTRDAQGRVTPSMDASQIGQMYAQAAPVRIPSALSNKGSSQSLMDRLSPQARATIQSAALRRDAAQARVQQQIDAQKSAAQNAANATAQNWAYNAQGWKDALPQGYENSLPIAARANMGQSRGWG